MIGLKGNFKLGCATARFQSKGLYKKCYYLFSILRSKMVKRGWTGGWRGGGRGSKNYFL